MGCKGMSEGMGTHLFFDACGLSQSFYDRKDHGPGELGAPAVEKQDIFRMSFYRQVDTDLVLIYQNVSYGCRRDGNKTLFVSFTGDPDKSFFKEKVGESQTNEL